MSVLPSPPLAASLFDSVSIRTIQFVFAPVAKSIYPYGRPLSISGGVITEALLIISVLRRAQLPLSPWTSAGPGYCGISSLIFRKAFPIPP